jgi:hypothetical protein
MASQYCENAVKLDREIAAKVKGMLGRGDDLNDIAVWFGVSVRVVQAVQSGAVHGHLAAAPLEALPPPGPYARATMGYGALHAVHAAEKRLHDVGAIVRKRYQRLPRR